MGHTGNQLPQRRQFLRAPDQLPFDTLFIHFAQVDLQGRVVAPLDQMRVALAENHAAVTAQEPHLVVRLEHDVEHRPVIQQIAGAVLQVGTQVRNSHPAQIRQALMNQPLRHAVGVQHVQRPQIHNDDGRIGRIQNITVVLGRKRRFLPGHQADRHDQR